MEKYIKKIQSGCSVSFTFLLKLYRLLISPLFGNRCRFYPSCSHYCEDAVKHFGFFRGGLLTIKRLLSCHPFHKGGYQPIPNKFLGREK